MAAPTTILGIGNGTGAGTADVTVAWPGGHQANDIGVLIAESADQAIALGTAAGFAEITGSPVSVVGDTRLGAFWCRATSGAQASPVITDPGNHCAAMLIVVRGCITTGNPWDQVTTDTGASSTSVTFPAVVTTVVDTLVLGLIATGTDTSTGQLGSGSSSSLSIEETGKSNYTALGTGGGCGYIAGTKATAGSTSGTTATLSTAGAQARMTLALKPPAAATKSPIPYAGTHRPRFTTPKRRMI